MEMIYKNGKTFWSPVSVSVSINSYVKWEQAFRVFSNIYCKANPTRSAELIEYNHIIHTVAQAYVWDNVYTYHKEFRLHMARNPLRSWAMILQQAWSLRLRDRLSSSSWANTMNSGGSYNKTNNNNFNKNEPCRRFNRGKCNFGPTCRYEHKCSYCFKFGHGMLTCRKAQADRERKTPIAGGESHFKQEKSTLNHAPSYVAQESNAQSVTKK